MSGIQRVGEDTVLLPCAEVSHWVNHLSSWSHQLRRPTIARFLAGITVKASMATRDLPKSQFGIDIENNFEPKLHHHPGKGSVLKELRMLQERQIGSW